MVPDPRLDSSFHAVADQVLKSLEDFNPSEWGLPPFEASASKYGSGTKEIEALVARKVQLMNTLITMHPDIECKLPAARYNLGVEVSDMVDKKAADSENVVSTTVPSAAPVVIIDSDDEDTGDGQNLHHFREISFPSPTVALLTDNVMVDNHKRKFVVKEEDKKVDKVKDKVLYLGVEDEFNEDNDGSTIKEKMLSKKRIKGSGFLVRFSWWLTF